MKMPRIDLDDLVRRNYGVHGKMNIMVIGANDGVSFDRHAELLFLERELCGVMIEPIMDYYRDLVKNFKHHDKLSLINAAVGAEELTLWRVCERKLGNYNEGARGLASQYRQHLVDCGVADSDIIVEKVKGVTVEEVTSSVQGQLDFLQIDTEGSDYSIFKELCIERLMPAICKIEVIHMKYWDVVSMVSTLHNLGYVTQLEDGDCIAFLPKRVSL